MTVVRRFHEPIGASHVDPGPITESDAVGSRMLNVEGKRGPERGRSRKPLWRVEPGNLLCGNECDSPSFAERDALGTCGRNCAVAPC